ncbi:substrate-binding domain-containing protein [Salmonella enterica]|nr:substrate-binding domain-containing protein [Salmonella enterica]
MQLNVLEAMNIYVNVVEQGSFIRAAEVLELHRPAVTRAVQNLEHDLGVKLLHRTTRQVSMTDEGGYRQALEEYGISPDPRWVISVPFNEEGGERAAHQLINSGLPLTAAVTFNDVMAAGIMRILHQRGVQLPQQLSIVGFDDVVLARYLYPALTTMHYPVEQMARCAAQLAIQLYRGITPPPSSNHFNAELVIRDSVAPYFSR